jgi:hypothetical protein
VKPIARTFTLAELLLGVTLCALVLGLVTLAWRSSGGANRLVAAAVSADGSTVAGVFGDGTVRVWERITGRTVRRRVILSDPTIRACTLSQSGDTLTLIHSYSNEITWEIKNDAVSWAPMTSMEYARAASRDGDWHAIGAGNHLSILRAGAIPVSTSCVIPQQWGAVGSITFSDNGRWLLVSTALGTGAVYPVASPLPTEPHVTISKPLEMWIGVSPNAEFLVSRRRVLARPYSELFDELTVYRPRSDELSLSVSNTRSLQDAVQGSRVVDCLSDFAFSPDSRLFAIAAPHEVQIWDLTTSEQTGAIAAAGVHTVLSADDGRSWVTASPGALTFWDAATLGPAQVVWRDRTDATLLLLCLGLGIVVFTWLTLRKRRQRQPCAVCGKPAPPAKKGQPPVCAACQRMTSTRTEARRRMQGSLWMLALVWLVAASAIAYFTRGVAGEHLWTWWLLLAMGVPVVLVSGLIAAFWVRSKLLMRKLRDEGTDLGLARRCADEEGTVVHSPPITAWLAEGTSLASDLSPALADARAVCESLLGRSLPEPTPLRLLVFRTAESYTAYLRAHGLAQVPWPGVYLLAPVSKGALSEERTREQLGDPPDTLRSLLANYCLELAWRGAPAWVGTALAHRASARGRLHQSARVVRVVQAALAAGVGHGWELFDYTPQKLGPRYVSTAHDDFVFRTSLGVQTVSVVEFMSQAAGGTSGAEALVGALAALRAGSTWPQACRAHFGRDVETLLADWRAWALAQQPPPALPPRDEVRRTIDERLLPVVRDVQALPVRRIEAIRTLAEGGYSYGAGVLVDLMRADENPILRKEAAWALACIAGAWHGEDYDAWRRWWAEVPAEVEVVGDATIPAP